MSKKFHDYAKLVKDENNVIFTGISYHPNLLEYESNFKEHTITDAEEYRPDKIVYKLYGVESVDWVLDICNDFTNGISEYTSGTIIQYPKEQVLRNLGII